MSTVKATLVDGRTVEFIPDMIGEGGMKRVYFTADKKSVLCFFKDRSAAKDPRRIARLENILGKHNPTVPMDQNGAARDANDADYFKSLFCWPTGIVAQPEFGIMTPAYSGNFFFGSGNWKGKEKQGMWFSSPKLRKLLPPPERGHWLNYLQLCKRMARAVRKMHMAGLAHSDLSSKNVLVDPPSGTCSVIDIDSLVVPGVYPPDVLGTPGYIAPEVLETQSLPVEHPNRKLPSNRTDLHALAVLIYEYLLRRHPLRGPKVNGKTAEEDELLSMGEKAIFIEHPQDASNRPKAGLDVRLDHLGPYLPNCFCQAFVDGLHSPTARPAAGDWERALYLSEDLVIPCGNSSCDEKWFLYKEGEKLRCPWCGWTPRRPYPVLQFHYAPRKGQFRPEGHCLVGWHNRPVYKWHVYKNVLPVEGADSQVQAYVQFYDAVGQWILRNVNLDFLVSPKGNPVPKGQAVALTEGDEVHLSKEEGGRLVSVKMVS